MTNAEWDKEIKKVTEFLNTIDLKSEMIDDENMYDFMNRLEEKYPYTSEASDTLFNCIDEYEFGDYLYKRYGISCAYEVIHLRVRTPKIERN